MRIVKCGNCRRNLQFLKQEKIQLGQTGAFLGDWPNILAGALEVEIYCCAKCGKIEFFRPEEYEVEEDQDTSIEQTPPEIGQHIVGVSRDGIPQVRCNICGKIHDFDYPRCPYCDHE